MRSRVSRETLGALTPEQRRALGSAMKRGEQHPDPAVAEAAYRWSHLPRWDRFTNRLPGWLLPLVALSLGALLVGTAIALEAPAEVIVAFTAAFVLVILMGLFGWVHTSTARKLRRIHPTDPAG